MRQILATWESRGGKHRVSVYRDEYGHGYTGTDCGGSLGSGLTDAEAVAAIEARLPDFQADANRTPMQRTGTVRP